MNFCILKPTAAFRIFLHLNCGVYSAPKYIGAGGAAECANVQTLFERFLFLLFLARSLVHCACQFVVHRHSVRGWQLLGNVLKAEGVPTIRRWEVRLGSIGGNTP